MRKTTCVLDALAMVQKQPRTAMNLREALQLENRVSAYKFITSLRNYGLIYVKDWSPAKGRTARTVPVFAANPRPFENPDMEKPEW